MFRFSNRLPVFTSQPSAAMDDEDVMCEAARNGHTDKVAALIESGVDVSYFDGDGLTPMMHAARHGHASVVKRLLEAGAPWNAVSPSNLSAGDFAMDSGHQDAFDLLLNAGSSLPPRPLSLSLSPLLIL